MKTFNYDDLTSCVKIIDWWNTKYPENRVTRNTDKYGVDLIGIDNVNFQIEVEHSGTWNRVDRPAHWGAVRVPIRKAKYWMPKHKETIYIQLNKELSACIIIDDTTMRNNFEGPSRVQLRTGEEFFFHYYTFEYHELTSYTPPPSHLSTESISLVESITIPECLSPRLECIGEGS